MSIKRSGYCTEFNIKNLGQEIALCGWVQKKRELGKLIFVDLRDRSGIMQLAFDDTSDKTVFDNAFKVHPEDVIAIKGIIRERVSKNKEIPTGDIEVEVTDLEILSRSQTPPFEITKVSDVKEETKLKYRYLELRNHDVQQKILMRHKIAKAAREYFYDNDFIEIETPILIKSTPEGARDYLVPSRVFNGKFFALPQSPQLYKQLLMLSGFDRYMQIAKCFRDEDLRADRQPEFTQIDLEASFVEPEDIMSLAEGFMKKVYKEVLDIEIETPFKRLTYNEAMDKYGSDKPDLRFGLEIVNIENAIKDSEFRVFSGALKNGGAVRGLNAKGLASSLSRKEIDSLTEVLKGCGAKGLAFTKINSDGTSSSSYEKFLSDDEKNEIRSLMNAEPNDVLFIVADSKKNFVLEILGILRCKLAEKFNLIDSTKPNLLWVVDFPLFEYDEEEKRFVSKHHPFTAPKDEDIDKLETEPQNAYAKAYDLVLNGNEVGGGSIRINNAQIQNKMFRALGFSDDEAKKRFGFLIEAFKYGTPPHGGMAFGLDRLVMVMLGCKSIREVIAFPKVASSAELMTDSPGVVDCKQLEELGIDIQGKDLDNNTSEDV